MLPWPELIKYLSIPVVAGIVGWSTNWVAIKMLFHPLRPIGKPPFFGWQGIIPSKAGKMGAITTDSTLSKLGSLHDIFVAIEPQKISAHLVRTLRPRLHEYIDEIMYEENPTFWELLPDMIKKVGYALVQQRIKEAVNNMVEEIGDRVEALIDLKHMVVSKLEAEPRIVNRIFQECGEAEFRFIVRSGWYFGFVFGIIQMVVWWFFPIFWILPVFGILIGYATNWIALRIVFQPLNPKKIGPFTLQGLFLKRREEVANIWCGIVTEEVLTVHNVMDAMLKGKHSDETRRLIRRHIRPVLDEVVGITKPVIQLTLGITEYRHLKEYASEKAVEVTSVAFADPHFNEERARIVREMLAGRMAALPPVDFQQLLRPAFQEEEIKLILIGAALGFLAGLAQWVYVFQ